MNTNNNSKGLPSSKPLLYTKRDINFIYFIAVFNTSGIDGLINEIHRLKSLRKHPSDIIDELNKY